MDGGLQTRPSAAVEGALSSSSNSVKLLSRAFRAGAGVSARLAPIGGTPPFGGMGGGDLEVELLRGSLMPVNRGRRGGDWLSGCVGGLFLRLSPDEPASDARRRGRTGLAGKSFDMRLTGDVGLRSLLPVGDRATPMRSGFQLVLLWLELLEYAGGGGGRG